MKTEHYSDIKSNST